MLTKEVKHVTKRLKFEMAEAVVTKDASDTLTIQGYANTSTKDRVGDVVLPSAFEKSLPTYLKNPVLLANHDWEDPIGVVTDAQVTDKGLFIKATISNTREDIKTLIREKCLRTFSIGYNEIDADYDDATKTKYVKELELLEISVVTVPANSEAMFDIFDQKAEAAAAEQAPAKTEDEQPAKAAFVSRMKEFVADVEKALDRKLEGNEVGAVCGYFIESKGDPMTAKELIAKLKSLPAPVAEAKQDGAAPAEPGQAQGADPMKALEAKIDAMAQALVKVVEMVEKLGGEKPAEEKPAEAKPEEEKPAEEKPADEDKTAEDEEKPADEKADDEEKKPEEEPEMTEEECEKELLEISAAIRELEDQPQS